MDKDLHNDIGEKFRYEINSLNQQPRAHIWENLDTALDTTDTKNYRDKFSRLKKRTILLLLLLITISTFSVIYFNNSENENNNYNFSEQKRKEGNANNETKENITSKEGVPLTKHYNQKQLVDENVAAVNASQSIDQGLFIPGISAIEKGGNSDTTKTNGNMTKQETAINDEIKMNRDNGLQKLVKADVWEALSKPESVQDTLPQISHNLKKDSIALAAKNPLIKSHNKNQRKNSSKFTLTAFVAPDYTEYHLINDKHNNYDNKVGIAKRESSDLSSSVGILMGYKTGRKTTIQSGIIYSSTNISIDPTKIYAEKDNAGEVKYRYNTSSGYSYLLPSFSSLPAVGDSLFANGANHTLHYLSIPIIAKYKLGNRKITFNPGVGFTLNFLTNATLTTDVEDRFNRETEYISKLESIKKFGCSLILIPEVQYQLPKNRSISAMPYFKYSLGAINKGNVVKTYPYTFGLGIGAVYKF